MSYRPGKLLRKAVCPYENCFSKSSRESNTANWRRRFVGRSTTPTVSGRSQTSSPPAAQWLLGFSSNQSETEMIRMQRYQLLGTTIAMFATLALLFFLRVSTPGLSWPAFWDNFTGTIVSFGLIMTFGAILAARFANRQLRSEPPNEQRARRRFATVVVVAIAFGWLLVASLLSSV